MTESSTGQQIATASISDRGLNPKRPLNEDSFLDDPERRIFAVADGVGGAEAGEVASQTAIEVLQEAFLHHKDGEDVEDLMEIAIQRANASIHQMSRDQPRFSMMATTIVALHLQGLRATIGHVGDSRLYSLTAGGGIRRETEDHSVVEEEVRAGRMTAEQAANHPSRNVISRALGAEPAVEVDMKTVEVEPGTTFLLCSDGITRHIPDDELASILSGSADLQAACAEMKRLCHERGAEDNLTAVLVRVGGGDESRPAVDAHADTLGDADDERTLLAHRSELGQERTPPDDEGPAEPLLRRPFDDVGGATPPASDQFIIGDGGAGAAAQTSGARAEPTAARRGGGGRVLAVLLLLAGFSALAFYGGMLYQRSGAGGNIAGPLTPVASPITPAPTATPLAADTAAASYMQRLREVDRNPKAAARLMADELSAQPDRGIDPEFLYPYGRALLLTNGNKDAADILKKATQLAGEQEIGKNKSFMIDLWLAILAARQRLDDEVGVREASQELDKIVESEKTPEGTLPVQSP